MRNHFAFHLMNHSKRKAHYTPRTPLSEFWFNKVGLGRPLSVPFLLRNSGIGSHRRAGSSGLRKRTHFSTTINLCYKVSSLLLPFVTFSEREPFLRGFLCWDFWGFWSQRCIGVAETCGRSFRSLPRLLTICRGNNWAYSFKSASFGASRFKFCH